MAGSGCGRAALGGAQLAGAQRSSSWGSGTMGHPLFTHAKAELWKQSMGLLSGAIAQTVLLSCSLRKFCPISPFSRHLRKSQGLCPSLTRRDPSLAKRILLLLLLLLAALPAGDLLTKACDKNSPGFITHAVGMPKQNRGDAQRGPSPKRSFSRVTCPSMPKPRGSLASLGTLGWPPSWAKGAQHWDGGGKKLFQALSETAS